MTRSYFSRKVKENRHSGMLFSIYLFPKKSLASLLLLKEVELSPDHERTKCLNIRQPFSSSTAFLLNP